jgi:hypothetical protein
MAIFSASSGRPGRKVMFFAVMIASAALPDS